MTKIAPEGGWKRSFFRLGRRFLRWTYNIVDNFWKRLKSVQQLWKSEYEDSNKSLTKADVAELRERSREWVTSRQRDIETRLENLAKNASERKALLAELKELLFLQGRSQEEINKMLKKLESGTVLTIIIIIVSACLLAIALLVCWRIWYRRNAREHKVRNQHRRSFRRRRPRVVVQPEVLLEVRQEKVAAIRQAINRPNLGPDRRARQERRRSLGRAAQARPKQPRRPGAARVPRREPRERNKDDFAYFKQQLKRAYMARLRKQFGKNGEAMKG